MTARTDAAPVNWNALKKLSKGLIPLLLSIVLGLASGVPVQASSAYVALSASQMKATFSIGSSSYYIGEGTTFLDVPIYASFSNYGSASSFEYISGMAYYSITNTFFTFDTTNNSVNVKKQYFVPSEVNDFSCLWLDSASLRLYFNNFTFNGSGTAYYILLGYMRYEFDIVPSGFTLTFTKTASSAIDPAVCNVRRTEYEYGFASAVADGIDDSQALQQLYQDLLAMKNAQSTFFASVSQDLYYMYNAVQSVDQWSDMIYNLLYDYIYPSQNPGDAASEAGQIAESMAAQEAAASASLAALSPGNMADLDAVEPLGILDTVSNSTQFWGTLVQEFSTASGAIWGVFIFALLVGLIGFILRLR